MSEPTSIPTSSQARRVLIALSVFLVVVAAVLLGVSIWRLESQYENLGAEVGRSFFGAVDTMRDWNLRHDGLYLASGLARSPNPALKHPLRDLETKEGRRLTMVNHAEMARLMAELLQQRRNISIHLTAVRPLRPGNAPDAWERDALLRIAKGAAESYGVVDGGARFRYMAPLKLEPTCLKCHQAGDSLEGTTLGGLSVSFSFAPFRQAMAGERNRLVLTCVTFVLIGLAIVVGMGRKLLADISQLQESAAQIKRLEGMLPICSHCKKIRHAGTDPAEQNSWVPIETYVQEHTDAEFTHGLCPGCARELYPNLSFGRPSGNPR